MKSAVLSFESVRESPFRFRSLPQTQAATSGRLPAFDYLRAFVIALVVWHHVMMGLCADGQVGQGGDYTQSTAPIVDAAQWSGFNLLVLLNDSFFMPLMFLLSGLFVRASLARKGPRRYLAERLRRLGVPLVGGILVVVPLSYYASYLQSGGTSGFGAFWRHMVASGPWPSGPIWFVGVLLIFDGATALILTRAGLPSFPALDRLSPARWFLLLLALSAIVYLPALEIFGGSYWLTAGPVGVQASRIGLYALYFAAGAIVGADRLAAALKGRWLRWALFAGLMLAVFFAVHTDAISARLTSLPERLDTLVDGVVVMTFSAAMAAGLLALALRFGCRPSAVGESLGANAYGIYLLHYPIVLWIQFAFLRVPLGAGAKALMVQVSGFGLSWLAASLLRRLPGVPRFV